MALHKEYRLTEDGVAELEKEMTELKARRVEIAERLKDAKAQGDLSENSEYTAAQDDHKYVETRINEIEHILRNVVLIDKPSSADSIELGNQVHLECGGKKMTYTVVGSYEADPQEGKISNESPIGKALMGQKLGDTVEIAIPSGKMSCKITKIV